MMQMATDPFQGNVNAIQGKEWRGVFRRRIVDYRLLFSDSREQGIVTVLRILLRSGETYR
jgi:mRNA-degrading endonuclease RelE of RelBE toxin-antitoxin system